IEIETVTTLSPPANDCVQISAWGSAGEHRLDPAANSNRWLRLQGSIGWNIDVAVSIEVERLSYFTRRIRNLTHDRARGAAGEVGGSAIAGPQLEQPGRGR